MKKLYNGKGKRVHPSPPTSPPLDHLSALPAAILGLAAVLTAEEQEVLAYLLSGGASGGERGRETRKQRRQNHPPVLGCGCFSCYKSFWARWDASPNRHVIHLIIDAFEETLESKEMGRVARGRSRRRRSGRKNLAVAEEEEEEKVGEKGLVTLDGHVADDDDDDDDDDDEDEDVGDGEPKSSVRRFVSFIGERVWGVWN